MLSSDAENAAVAGLVFRNFLRQSPEGALDALRAAKRDSRMGFTWNEGLLNCLAESFIRICSSRQQEKALRFIEERLRDSGFVKPSVSLALCLLPHHPELAIEVISRRPREFLPDVRWDELLDSFEVPKTTSTPWPVAEDIAAPPGPDEFRTRALRAIENAALDEETRDALLKTIR